MYLWRGADKLSFAFGDKPNGVICKLVTVKDHIFAATTTNNLYHGEVSLREDTSSPALVFKRAQFDVVDLASNSEHLFVVNTSGHVLKVNPQDMSVVDSIILKEEVKYCSHGYVGQKTDIPLTTKICINLVLPRPFDLSLFLLFCSVFTI